MVRVAEVVPEPDATKLVPVVVAVSHAELDANVNPCALLFEEVTSTVWAGGGTIEPNEALKFNELVES